MKRYRNEKVDAFEVILYFHDGNKSEFLGIFVHIFEQYITAHCVVYE